MDAMNFFNQLKENEVDITIKVKDSALNLSGNGVGMFLGARTIQDGLDYIEKQGFELPFNENQSIKTLTNNQNNEKKYEFENQLVVIE